MLSKIRKYRWIIPMLVTCFGVSAAGVHLEVHLCHGHLASVKLISLDDKSNDNVACCPEMCQHEEGDNGCCDDEEIATALDYDGIVQIIEDIDDRPITQIPQMDFTIELPQVLASDRIVLSDTGPPPLGGYILRIRYQSFLC